MALYLRQSQDRTGKGYGVDRQRDDCRRLIKARGWTVVAEFVDNDTSATKRKPRPQFVDMMARVDGGEFDVIVSRHMDRLLRRLAELENVLERCEKTGTTIVTAADSVDTGNDGGRLVARILSSVAQGEVERKGARQRSALAQGAKRGEWLGGRRPFGYESDGMTVRENEAAAIKAAYAEVLAGESQAEIARRLNAQGFTTGQGHPWTRYPAKEMLCNPRNAGLRRHTPTGERDRRNPANGIVGAAAWPAIVDEVTWRAAVAVLTDPARQRKAKAHKGLLTGVARCAVCGQPVRQTGGRTGAQLYRCVSGKHISRTAAPIDELVEAIVLGRLKAPDAAALWTPKLPDVCDLIGEADVLRRRRDDIAASFADGEMSREQFRTANTRIGERLAELEGKISAAGSASPLAIVADEDIDQRWSTLSTAQRRSIIAAIGTPVIHSAGQPGPVTMDWAT